MTAVITFNEIVCHVIVPSASVRAGLVGYIQKQPPVREGVS